MDAGADRYTEYGQSLMAVGTCSAIIPNTFTKEETMNTMEQQNLSGEESMQLFSE
jgi:hypothetical protein